MDTSVLTCNLPKDLPVCSPKRRRIKKIRGFMKKVRSMCLQYGDVSLDSDYSLDTDSWCNFAHLHLDWNGYGDYSKQARLLFLQQYAKHFNEFIEIFSKHKGDFQLWLAVHPYDSGADCLYCHTPNPHTQFPVIFHDVIWDTNEKNLFTSLMPQYKVIEGKTTDNYSFFYYVEGVGVAPR